MKSFKTLANRSFKDGRYYTVSKKDTNRFHKEAAKKSDKEHMKEGQWWLLICTGAKLCLPLL
jgi:hypothetical protein